MLEINKEDLSDLENTLSKIERVDEAFKVFAQAVYENSIDKVNREHNVTGGLRESLYLEHVDDGYILGADYDAAPYARFVHEGTPAHTIVPNKRKVLRWVQNSRFIFAKEVHHPGYKGDPFFYDAIDEEKPQIDKIFGRWIDDL